METKAVIFPAKAQKWGILSLLFAIAICLFKWTPFSGVLSFVPLLGYLCIGKWGKNGLIISSLLLLGLGAPFLFSSSDRFFFSCFLCALLTSYYLLYLEREEAKSKGFECNEERAELLQELEKWKKSTASVKATLIELEAKAGQERRGLQREVETLSASLQAAEVSLKESLHLQKEWQERCIQVESDYQKLQGSLYQDTKSETVEEDPALIEEWKHQYELVQEQLSDSVEALNLARKDSAAWESQALILQKQGEELAYAPSKEVEVLTCHLQSLTEECQSLEKQVDSLQELVSLLLPFARTHLHK